MKLACTLELHNENWPADGKAGGETRVPKFDTHSTIVTATQNSERMGKKEKKKFRDFDVEIRRALYGSTLQGHKHYQAE